MDRTIDPSPKRRGRILVASGVAGAGVLAVTILAGSISNSRVRLEAAKIQVATVEKGLFREFIPVTGTSSRSKRSSSMHRKGVP
jgi:hypothetical protein